MAHSLPLDELLAAVAATAFGGGYSCDDRSVPNVFGHAQRRNLADDFDPFGWLFDFHCFLF